MSKRKRKNGQPNNCEYCEHCIYVGEGGYMCDMSNEIVIDDFEPTEDFYMCDGKDFLKI
jgi:hypothetical protein